MKAYQLTPGQGIDGITLVDRPDPEPGPGQVVVRMRATSLNYRDYLMTRWARTPVVPLSDGAGDVVAVGEGVTGVAVGDRVAGCFFPFWVDGAPTEAYVRDAFGGGIDGMLAELVALPAEAVVPLPAYMTYDEAATLPCAALTAWNAMFVQARLHPGQSVLLLGTGGVSVFGLQFGRLAGVRTIITSSSDAKLLRAKELGADVTINYREREDWDRAALEATGGRGVDCVLEVAGSATFARSLSATRFNGDVVIIGALATEGADPGTAPLVTKNIRATRVYVGSRVMFEDMMRALELRELHPVIDRTFEFDEAREAYRMMEAQGHFGKIVVRC
ncbi:MAG: NAD(P)-dependent alcohol dehydrogenase [Dehalococcoidia bacterium]|nr:NAD(P)-dependent alcohol dehydrogenase [Dehalococcoidia bacterium]